MLLENASSLYSLMIASIGALISGGSLLFSYKQWKKMTKKIEMIYHTGSTTEIRPYWYQSRMLNESWRFGLLTVGGNTIVISQIKGISEDGKWLDVELVYEDEATRNANPTHVYAIEEKRTTASVKHLQ